MQHFVYMWLQGCITVKINTSEVGGKKCCSTLYAVIQLMQKGFSTAGKLQITVDIVLVQLCRSFDHLDHNLIIPQLDNM